MLATGPKDICAADSVVALKVPFFIYFAIDRKLRTCFGFVTSLLMPMPVLNFRPSGASSGGSGGASSVVSDRVRAASAAYAAQLDRAERGGGGGGSIESTGLVDVPTTNDVQTLRIEC